MPGDGSSVRDALNHQSLQVSRDDPGPRPMIAVLDARPGLAGRLREKIAEQLAAQVRREPGCLTFTAYEARDVPGRFYLYEVYASAARVHRAPAGPQAGGAARGSPRLLAAAQRRRLVLSGKDDTPPSLPPKVMREIETGGRALMEYMMARGPEPGDLSALRAYGYRPEAVVQVEQDRLQREERLAAMLRDGTASRDRLGDLVHARYLFWKLDSHLRAGLEQYGIDGDDFFANGKEWLSGFLDDIPARRSP